MNDAQKKELEECAVEFHSFQHYEELTGLLDKIPSLSIDSREAEILETQITILFDYYQAQPRLMDVKLKSITERFLQLFHDWKHDTNKMHFIFRIMLIFVKTRGYKHIIRHLPHAVIDLEPTLVLLSQTSPTDYAHWQTSHILILWLCVVVTVPFNLDTMGDKNDVPISKRILEQAMIHLSEGTGDSAPSAFLLSKLISRPDMSPSYLRTTINWSLEHISQKVTMGTRYEWSAAGQLRFLCNLCRHCPRAELVPFLDDILQMILNQAENVRTRIKLAHLLCKLAQRLGLLYCPPNQFANWRYQKSHRSLRANLNSEENKSSNFDAIFEGDYDFPEQLSDIMDFLLNALRSDFTQVRWSASKGLARICTRLSNEMVTDVIRAVLCYCVPLERHSAWHGACLALAELARRGLLLPDRLSEAIPVVLRALFFDERSGDCSYGSNVRDAACYVCWAFARAYEAEDLAPFVDCMARALILASLFDREVPVRRAASAAFQENVGRQGQFPHGIEILTTCDFHAVGNVTNCYTKLCDFVATFPAYVQPMLDHLSSAMCAGHWDLQIRLLTARAVALLAHHDPDYAKQVVLPRLIEKSLKADLNMRQGCVFSIASCVDALGLELLKDEKALLSNIRDIIMQVAIVGTKGLTGEYMRRAVCYLVEKVSSAKLPFHDDKQFLETTLDLLLDCSQHQKSEIMDAAVPAFAAFLRNYLSSEECDLRGRSLNSLRKGMCSKRELSRVGSVRVIGQAPYALFVAADKDDQAAQLLDQLIACCAITPSTQNWIHGRRASCRSLPCFTQTLVAEKYPISGAMIGAAYDALLNAFEDYTIDAHGDSGSLVRMDAMEAATELTLSLRPYPELVQASQMDRLVVGLGRQALEKIDRVRRVAGQSLHQLLHAEPEVPCVPDRNALLELLPEEDLIDWQNATGTFHRFVRLLDLPRFHQQSVLGLSTSVGVITRDTSEKSREALCGLLSRHAKDPDFARKLLSTSVTLFSQHMEDERLIVPMTSFIEFLFSDSIFVEHVNSNKEAILKLLDLVWQSTRKCVVIQRLKAAGSLLCTLLQFDGEIRTRTCSKLMVLLGHHFPLIRQVIATKLYEAFLVHDVVEDPDVLEKINNLLMTTVWTKDLRDARLVRNEIALMLGIQPPQTSSEDKSESSLSIAPDN